MDLQLKEQGTYAYDMISLGEIMLRLDPGEAALNRRVPFVRGRAAVNTTLRADCVGASG